MNMTGNRIRPIFVLSIPRSGSTMLQRLTAAHPAVCTASEPWILLPLLYTLRGEGSYTEYAHKAAAMATEDFLRAAGLDQKAFVASVVEFVCGLYGNTAQAGEVYFLDKTPRYHLIAGELLDALPEAKFIFLWRNPAAVAASMLQLSPRRQWNLHEYKVDLYRGVASLVDLYVKYRQDSRVMASSYEQLVANPRQELGRIFDFLELDIPADIGHLDDNRLIGRLGDPRASAMQEDIDAVSVDKWKLVMANPFRRYWLRRYVRWIGAERLAVMGYNLSNLEREIAALPAGLACLPGDLAGLIKGLLSNTLEGGVFRDKYRQPGWRRVPHR